MATQVTVSFPDEFLAEIDRIAYEKGYSRSELLREAMRLYIEVRRNERRPSDDSRVRAVIAKQNALSRKAPGAGEESVDDIRHWREARR